MSLSTLIAAIQARIATAVTGTTYVLGWREADARGAPPRVEWRPTRHAYEAPYQGGSRADGFARAILGRAQAFEVTLWGVDVAQVEALFDALVRGCEAEAAGAWAYTGGDWARVGAVTAGEAMLCTVTLGAHVLETAPSTVTITGAALAPATSTPGDGVLEFGETP